MILTVREEVEARMRARGWTEIPRTIADLCDVVEERLARIEDAVVHLQETRGDPRGKIG